MSKSCGRTFDEALLTGHLDGVLTQAEDQRVRLHLETCADCRRLIEELGETREATMTTRFELPRDDQWSEVPRGPASRLSFGLGWTLLLLFGAGMLGLVVSLIWTDSMPLTVKLLLFAGLGGLTLLLLSELIDRLKTLRNDPYRSVDK